MEPRIQYAQTKDGVNITIVAGSSQSLARIWVSAMSNPTVRMRIRDTVVTSSSLLYSLSEYGLRGAGAVIAITVSVMKFISVSGGHGPCF